MPSKKRALVKDRGVGKQRQMGRRLSKRIASVHREITRDRERQQLRAKRYRYVWGSYGESSPEVDKRAQEIEV
jgi:hypothetical protein